METNAKVGLICLLVVGTTLLSGCVQQISERNASVDNIIKYPTQFNNRVVEVNGTIVITRTLFGNCTWPTRLYNEKNNFIVLEISNKTCEEIEKEYNGRKVIVSGRIEWNGKPFIPWLYAKEYDIQIQENKSEEEIWLTGVEETVTIGSGKIDKSSSTMTMSHKVKKNAKKVKFTLWFDSGDLDLYIYDERGKYVGKGKKSSSGGVISIDNITTQNFTIKVVPVDVPRWGTNFYVTVTECPERFACLSLHPYVPLKGLSLRNLEVRKGGRYTSGFEVREICGFHSLLDVEPNILTLNDITTNRTIDSIYITFDKTNFAVDAHSSVDVEVKFDIPKGAREGVYHGKIRVFATDSLTGTRTFRDIPIIMNVTG